MENYINDYIDYLKYEKKLSEETYKNYHYDLNDFQVFLKKENISDIKRITLNDIEKYIQNLNKNISSRTQSRKLSAINNFFKYLLMQNIIIVNPCDNIKRPKLAKKLPNVLSIEEVDNLLDIPLNTVFDYRNKAMLELLYSTGLRISEALDLKTRDIDFENNVIRCIGKGNKERIVPINDYALSFLKEYMERKSFLLKLNLSDYVFLNSHGKRLSRQGFTKNLNTILESKNINKNVSPHILIRG